MPRPGFPPTPISSTEIHGKEPGETIEDFSLGPAALHTTAAEPMSSQGQVRPRGGSSSGAGDGQDSATGGTKRKRRTTNADMQIAAQATSSDAIFSVPPPPSRSRKIIQVQPEDAAKSTSKTSSSSGGRKRGGTGNGSSGSGPSKSTAASRKTARKTAHSIIERRRRSKMNDEFETLKEMVPAARGQNMHKLAILQAGIEYVRYLEDCVQGLKGAQPSTSSSYRGTPLQMPTDLERYGSALQEDDIDEDEDEENDEMEEDGQEQAECDPQTATTPRASRPGSVQQDTSNMHSPAIYPAHGHPSSSSYAISTGSPSPAILPSYNSAYSATSASSTLPSPALLPSDYRSPRGSCSYTGTPLTNPAVDYHALQAHAKKALACHGEADQEVIATLTMMGTERRRSQEEKDRADGTRGMSVRDLLST